MSHATQKRTVPLGQMCWCGQIHERCAAHKKAGYDYANHQGTPCMSWPDKKSGLEVCNRHGGTTKAARTNGETRLTRTRALGEVGQLLNEMGDQLRGRTIPEALQACLDQAGAMVAILQILVAELDVETTWDTEEQEGAEERFDGPGRRRTPVVLGDRIVVGTAGLFGPDHKGNQKPHVLVQLYGEWVDRYGRLVKVAADLGLEERRVAIDETRAQAVVGAVLAGLRDAGADTPEVRTAIAGRLRALEAGGPRPVGEVA